MREYYNPDLTPAEMQVLDWQNWVTLMANQAAAGAISTNTVAVLVHPGEVGGPVEIEVVLRCAATKADDEAFADLADALDNYLGGHHEIATAMKVDASWTPGLVSRSSRMIFLKRRHGQLDGDDEVFCAACGSPIEANARVSADIFEGMHWVCFHYLFEHETSGLSIDRDRACSDPACPARSFDPDPPPDWLSAHTGP